MSTSVARVLYLHQQVIPDAQAFVPKSSIPETYQSVESQSGSRSASYYGTSASGYQEELKTSQFGSRFNHRQEKTFIRWINFLLSENEFPLISSFEEFSDGTVLRNLISVLSNKPVPKFKITKANNKRGAVWMHQRVSHLLSFLEEQKVPLFGVSASNIVQCETSFVLRLIWSLINFYFFPIQTRFPEDILIHWIRDTLEHYPVSVKSYSSSFSDGTVLLALLHRFCPHFPFEPLSKLSSFQITSYVLNMAHKWLKIPILLDPQDISDGKADKNSLVLYLSFFYSVETRSSSIKTDTPTSFSLNPAELLKTAQKEAFFAQQKLKSIQGKIFELEETIKAKDTVIQNQQAKIKDLESKITVFQANEALSSIKSDNPRYYREHSTTSIPTALSSSDDNTPSKKSHLEDNDITWGSSMSKPVSSTSFRTEDKLPALDLDPVAKNYVSRLQAPPSGYKWTYCQEISGALLCPNGWTFRKRRRGPRSVDYLLSPQGGQGRFVTMVLVNCLLEHHIKTNIPSLQYAKSWIQELVQVVKKTQHLQMVKVNAEGSLNGIYKNFFTIHVDKEKIPHVRLVHLVIVNSKTNSIYSFNFRTPDTNFKENFAIASKIFSTVSINSKI